MQRNRLWIWGFVILSLVAASACGSSNFYSSGTPGSYNTSQRDATKKAIEDGREGGVVTTTNVRAAMAEQQRRDADAALEVARRDRRLRDSIAALEFAAKTEQLRVAQQTEIPPNTRNTGATSGSTGRIPSAAAPRSGNGVLLSEENNPAAHCGTIVSEQSASRTYFSRFVLNRCSNVSIFVRYFDEDDCSKRDGCVDWGMDGLRPGQRSYIGTSKGGKWTIASCEYPKSPQVTSRDSTGWPLTFACSKL